MKEPVPRGKTPIATLIAVLVVLVGATAFAFQATSTTDFCASCHVMKRHRTELNFSSHKVDKDKNPIDCVQCHLPNSFGPKYVAIKTYLGVKDMVVNTFGDPDEFYRAELQVSARLFIDDESCRACHEDMMKTTKDKPISIEGKLAHEAYLGKNGCSNRGCADCHQNMAHLPDFDRRYVVNADFAAKLPREKDGM